MANLISAFQAFIIVAPDFGF